MFLDCKASSQNLLIFAIFKSSLNFNLARHWSQNFFFWPFQTCPFSSGNHIAVAKSLEIICHVTNCCKRPIMKQQPWGEKKCTLIKMLQKLTSAVPLRISASPFCLNWPQAVAVIKKPQNSDGLMRGANPRLITGLPASLKRQVWEMIIQMKKKLNSLLKYLMKIVCHQWKMVATDTTFQIPWLFSDESKVRLWIVSLSLAP